MQRILIVFMGLLAAQAAFGQNTNMTTEDLLRYTLRTGIEDGHVTKYLRLEGDSAAVTITKILGDKAITDTEIDQILGFISAAFSDLRLVSVISDREPRTTLFLLKYLDRSTTTTSLKGKISEAKQQVLSAYAKLAERQ